MDGVPDSIDGVLNSIDGVPDSIDGCNAPRSCLLKRDSFLRFSVGECLDVREKLAAGV